MKSFNEYKINSNDIKLRSALKIFEKQLYGIEGEEITINDSINERVLIMNHLNPLNENKEERHIAARINTILKRGDYVKIKDMLNAEEIYMVFSRMDNHKYNKQGKIRFCNQFLMCQGQSKPIPCIADNTTYGVKGVKDNGYFLEGDAKLKIWVQKNKETDRYYEGMRFIFNNKTAYQVTKVDDVVLDNIYVLESTLVSLSPLDDLKNNIAYNEKLDKIRHSIKGDNKIKLNDIKSYMLEPENASAIFEIEGNYGEILNQSNSRCEVKAIKGSGIITLKSKVQDKIISEFNIITM